MDQSQQVILTMASNKGYNETYSSFISAGSDIYIFTNIMRLDTDGCMYIGNTKLKV